MLRRAVAAFLGYGRAPGWQGAHWIRRPGVGPDLCRAALACWMLGCHGRAAPSDGGPADTAPATSPMAVPSAMPTPALDALLDAHVPAVGTRGTIGLLVEHVFLDPGQAPPSSYGFDLVVMTKLPGTKAIRSQPFCPPLKRDMYEVCRRFRSCAIPDARATVVCDAESFELIQHDGGTYLHYGSTEIQVSKDTPSVVAPTARERRAYIDL